MVKTTEAPEKLRPYLFHGVDINRDPTQASGACPFCSAESKFGVQTSTGQYRCVRCDESGNIYSFLARLHAMSLDATTAEDYAALAELRGLSPASLLHFGLAKSVLTGEWLVPAYNAKGNLSNLFRVVETATDSSEVRKLTLHSTPTCKLQPFGANRLIQSPRPIVWVAEGVWDACALWDALRGHRLGSGGKLIKTTAGNTPEGLDNTLLGRHAVIAVPGSNSFSPEWFELLEGKDTRLVFDNDHPKRYPVDHPKAGELIPSKEDPSGVLRPGYTGMCRVVKLAGASKHRPSKLSILEWSKYQGFPDGPKPVSDPGHHPDLPDGFDIRDLMKADGPTAGLLALQSYSVPAQLKSPPKKSEAGASDPDVSTVVPIPCNSFEELCNAYSSALHFTQDLRDTLAVMLTVVLSTQAKTDHIWLRVIGPPGSGKSTLAEAISAAREYVTPKSLLTGFHSGFVDMNDEAGKDKDASPIARMNGKTVMWKDADTLINSPGRDRMLGEMRDFYDGTSRAEYRNNVSNNYEDLRITFILCGTDELRSLNRTFLGERFLDCEIMRRGEDATPYLRRATQNTYSTLVNSLAPPPPPDADEISPNKFEFLKQVTYGFLKYLKEGLSSFHPPEISEAALSTIESMGQFVSYMRARIRHDGPNSDLTYRPRAELATRLCSQFTKLSFFSSLVLGRSTVDVEVLRLVRKVVHDTALGFQFEITELLAREALASISDGRGTDDHGCSVQQINRELNIPETSLRRLLGDMREFGIIQPYSVPNNSGQRGRDRHVLQLTPMMVELWRASFAPAPTINTNGEPRRKAATRRPSSPPKKRPKQKTRK